MTGPRSPSSPWVQSPQAHRDGAQSFQLTKSPSHAGVMSNPLDRPSPNYFGMSSHNPGNQQTSTTSLVQKNWGSSPPQSSHSPMVHVHPQELVSAGLVNMLKTEPETSRIRRESTFNEASNGKQISPGSNSPFHPLGSFSLGTPSGPRQGTGRSSVSAGN